MKAEDRQRLAGLIAIVVGWMLLAGAFWLIDAIGKAVN